MNKISQILEMDENKAYDYFSSTLKDKITRWDYFVNWKKVLSNISTIEHELNLMNSLIGKTDIDTEAKKLFQKYPSVIKAIPALLAVRDNSVKVLVDVNHFVYKKFDFSIIKPNDFEIEEFASFIQNSGLGELITSKRIKNLVDYVIGVEVGLDSNGRKNRGGSLMESIVETFVARDCLQNNVLYMSQATANKIFSEWNIKIDVDKSSRIIDFAINKKGKLYFIETNFYGGGGSKLKSTATEYTGMNSYWNEQEIEFIWVTDGAGWRSTLRPLREYFDKADFLMNLEMLKNGCLDKIIKRF
ncbi:MAG: type II restriction endonuclease [Bacteroidales bacterium]|nr:type II restriction endonuclease [Bacteroidales bacterium]